MEDLGFSSARLTVFQESESLEGKCDKIEGYDFNEGVNYPKLLRSMLTTGFQASHLGEAIDIVNQMLDWRLSDEATVAEDCSEEEKDPSYRESVKCKIFLGFTSNLASSGLRDTIRYLVQHHMVDVIVTTAGGVDEDLIKCLAPTFKGDYSLPGAYLRSKFEDWIMPIFDEMLKEQKEDNVWWTPSKVLARLGKEINNESSYLYWAYKMNIPVFCPVITDGSLGYMLHHHPSRNPGLLIDSVQDIKAMNGEAVHATPRRTGMIILGGGTPKHHICNANLMRNGADYAVFINTEQEFDGSDSGARPDEAVSWGKIRASAKTVKVYCDATIVFPLLVAETFATKREQTLEVSQHPVVHFQIQGNRFCVHSTDFKESESQEGKCDKIEGYDFNEGVNYPKLLRSMLTTGFQASHLGEAIDIVNQMLDWRLSDEATVAEDCSEEEKDPSYRESVKCKIFLGFTSNLVSSGLRDTIRYLVQHHMVDVIVTTAGGVEEDLIKCLAPTFKGDFSLPGAYLRSKGLNRTGNLVVPNGNYCKFEEWITPIFDEMLKEQKEENVLWTPSKVFARLGKEINNESSYLYWAYKMNIPVFCPGLTDGSLGDMLYFHSVPNPGLAIDAAQDIRAMNGEAIHATPRKTGMVILGGGMAKDHICNANMMCNGADYAVFVDTGQEFDGSDSGARPDEAVSWGKIKGSAETVKVNCDATIAFPLLVAETFATKREQTNL